MSPSFLYTFTGNPFVDTGMWVMCEWSGRKKYFPGFKAKLFLSYMKNKFRKSSTTYINQLKLFQLSLYT